MDERVLEVGDAVTYRDEHRIDHNALVTAIHGPACINLVYVTKDSAKRDSFGLQTEHATSVQLKSELTADGRYYTV